MNGRFVEIDRVAPQPQSPNITNKNTPKARKRSRQCRWLAFNMFTERFTQSVTCYWTTEQYLSPKMGDKLRSGVTVRPHRRACVSRITGIEHVHFCLDLLSFNFTHILHIPLYYSNTILITQQSRRTCISYTGGLAMEILQWRYCNGDTAMEILQSCIKRYDKSCLQQSETYW